MWRPFVFVLTLTLSTLAIKVPVDGNSTHITSENSAENKQDTFYISDQANVDSYLIPPDPHKPEDVLPDVVITPATYLLPPSPEKQFDYYAPPPEAGEQTDWYPIPVAQAPLPSTSVNLLPQNQQDDFLPQSQQSDFSPQSQQGDFLPQTQQSDFSPQSQQGDFLPQSQQGDYFLPQNQQSDFLRQNQQGDFLRQNQQTDFLTPNQQVTFLPQNRPFNLLHQGQDSIPIVVGDNQFEIFKSPRGGKSYQGQQLTINLPSTELEPPLQNTPTEYALTIPLKEIELPSEYAHQHFYPPPRVEYQQPTASLKPVRKNPKKATTRPKPVDPTLALHLIPPKSVTSKYKNPTKIYPKKVTKGFKPVPIPLSQFAEDNASHVPRAKPAKLLKPTSSDENDYFARDDDKKVYLYEQTEKKRRLKAEKAAKQNQAVAAVENTYGNNGPTEQETSETHNYRHPGHQYNTYPVHLRQPPPAPAPIRNVPAPASPAPGERTEFRMHGLKGPHSYQFGFDTGKGKNRQFRYEERDNDGRVKGHYGYVDKLGKLRVVNYDADPEHGFHAEAPVEKDE